VGLIRYFLHQNSLGLVPYACDGRLVFAPVEDGASAAPVASTAAPPVAETAGSQPTSQTPIGGKGVTQQRVWHAARGGLLSRDVSPESDGEHHDEDMDTVVAKIATRMMRGGGFPKVQWHME
jgi:hypothetical protein